MNEQLVAQYLQQVDERLAAIFAGWANGMDVPPGERLRLEGYIQAGIQLGLASRDEMLARIQRAHLDQLGEPLRGLFPPMDDESVLPLPARMKRAPVIPSTRD